MGDSFQKYLQNTMIIQEDKHRDIMQAVLDSSRLSDPQETTRRHWKPESLSARVVHTVTEALVWLFFNSLRNRVDNECC